MQLRNVSVDHHRLTVVTNTFLLTTALIMILVGPVSEVFQALLLVST